MQALRVIYAIWLREVKLFVRERGRIIGMIGQPLMYLLIVGQGIASGLTLNRSPGGLGYMLFLYPGILGMSVLFTSIFSAISIIWDREFGFLKEVLVAPVPRWAVAAGKVLGGATVATLQSAILLLLAPLAGMWPTPLVALELLLLCFLMSCAMTSLGVAIAARMRSMQGFQMVMNFLVMPLYFLSGAMFPVSSAPGWMKSLMTADPLTYGVDALRTVFLSAAPGESGALQEAARVAGLIRFDLLIDVAVMAGGGVPRVMANGSGDLAGGLNHLDVFAADAPLKVRTAFRAVEDDLAQSRSGQGPELDLVARDQAAAPHATLVRTFHHVTGQHDRLPER